MRLHLIDGTYELFRAHYSKRPDHRAPGGWDAKATVGVVASLLALLHHPDEEVTHLAVAFDNPIRSFRNDLFAGYKSDEGMDPALRAQLDPVEEAVRALGVVVWTMADFEADDALATAAARLSGEVEQVRILSPDKDFGQCLSGERVVQVDRRKERVIDEAALRAARGVGPASIPDFLALTGDDADGIPGLAGIGERTAAALLGAYGHIERIPSDPAAWTVAVRGADRIARVLNEEREAALLYRRLATLRTDVPLAERLDDLRFRGVPRARFEAWCDAMDVRTLKRRPTRWA
ncbi:5'-3' exonuclease H3TH domain-containing protein [Sorangium sp. So ce1036]|uniref:5'-3' exonuclease n=1 Tax=Sorangium sp. So ce1036 TaxID=3133328 RepID=UPI003F06110C